MPDPRVRQQIARIAAQMMYERLETEYFTAKRKAARQIGIDARYHPKDLPSNAEIRDEVQILACLKEGDTRRDNLRAMRLIAFWLMRKLERFHPALIGSTWTGHIRKGSDIDIHIFSNSYSAISMALDDLGLPHDVEHKRIVKHNEERVFTHIHIDSEFPVELTVYPEDKISYVFKSSITGKAIERATLPQLEAFLREEYPDTDLDETADPSPGIDDYDLFKLLLEPLEKVKQNPQYHPEGDALYHSLQVFQLARDERPWDEEFLLAALLHDVGKGIDSYDHVNAGLEALEGHITERTKYLIEHHMDAHKYRAGTLGHRAGLRLAESEDFDDLLLLSELDQAGRVCGVEVCSIDEALTFIRNVNPPEDSDEFA
jgi:uncharacterized protein YuzE